MEDTELLMNIIALGILVITAIVNICVQMGTGVIFEFWIEHGLIMVLMVILLAILCSLTLAIPTKKYFLDFTYEKKLKKANLVCFTRRNVSAAERLKHDLGKYWMMAYTSSPQFVIGRSAPCSASGAFCLLNMLILGESILRTRLMPWSFEFCKGDSDYKWSTTLVLVSQTAAVAVGTVSPACRWFMTINFRCPTKAARACGQEFRVERYCLKRMRLWQVQPLELRSFNRRGRRLVHGAKFEIFRFLIAMQKGLILCCKMIRFVSIFFLGKFLRLRKVLKGRNSVHSTDSTDSENTNTNTNTNREMSRYVIYLEGEDGLVDLMMENNSDATPHWIKMGEKQQPRHLIKLLERASSSTSFNGVRDFDSDRIPSLCNGEPPHCWALPIVTLTSIAVALSFSAPNTDRNFVEHLVRGVDEGLKLIKDIENYLEKEKELKHVRKAAEIVWSGVELHHKWLDVDLSMVPNQESYDPETDTNTIIIKSLAEISKQKFTEFMNKDIGYMNDYCLKEVPSRWPMKIMAANSMYRVCETLMLTKQTDCRLLEKVFTMICDVLMAGLSNLQHVIARKCHESRIEEREKSIRSAVLLFGKSRRILEILDGKRGGDWDHGKLIGIDEWGLGRKGMEAFCEQSSSSSIDEDENGESSPLGFYVSVQ